MRDEPRAVSPRRVYDLGTPEQLEQLAAVKFDDYDLADLVEVVTLIAESSTPGDLPPEHFWPDMDWSQSQTAKTEFVALSSIRWRASATNGSGISTAGARFPPMSTITGRGPGISARGVGSYNNGRTNTAAAR